MSTPALGIPIVTLTPTPSASAAGSPPAAPPSGPAPAAPPADPPKNDSAAAASADANAGASGPAPRKPDERKKTSGNPLLWMLAAVAVIVGIVFLVRATSSNGNGKTPEASPSAQVQPSAPSEQPAVLAPQRPASAPSMSAVPPASVPASSFSEVPRPVAFTSAELDAQKECARVREKDPLWQPEMRCTGLEDGERTECIRTAALKACAQAGRELGL